MPNPTHLNDTNVYVELRPTKATTLPGFAGPVPSVELCPFGTKAKLDAAIALLKDVRQRFGGPVCKGLVVDEFGTPCQCVPCKIDRFLDAK